MLFPQPGPAPDVPSCVATRGDALLPAFAGFFFALALARDAHGPATSPEVPLHEVVARAPDPLAQGCQLDPDAMCVRDLRRLPAVGPARALSIVRARFDEGLRGGPGAWERISGIGTETVRAAGSWLAAARSARLSAGAAGAYTPRGRRP